MPIKIDDASILTINGGSSSLKFALFDNHPPRLPSPLVRGKVVRIGLTDCQATITPQGGSASQQKEIDCPDLQAAAAWLVAWLQNDAGNASIQAVAHRVVHGGPKYHEPQPINETLLNELQKISFLDPDHLPGEITLIERFRQQLPAATHVACFDTAFHHDMPQVAQIIPIPRRYQSRGLRRYGFHGLSYAYLVDELARTAGPPAAAGRLILAHLGAGASMAAVREGRSIDTTMGLTPTSGLVMATRTGDVDPSLPSLLARQEAMSIDQFHDMVNHQSGLLGLSETTSDFRELLTREPADPRAAEALAVFVYHARKAIGALAASSGRHRHFGFLGRYRRKLTRSPSSYLCGARFSGYRPRP